MQDLPRSRRTLGSRIRKKVDEVIDLVWDTIKDTFDDRLPGLAAEVAFYLVLSLPPLLLVILGLLGYVGEFGGESAVADIKDQLLNWADNIFSASTIQDTIEPAIDDLLERGRADVLTVGGVIAVWSGSRAARVVVDAVTIAYDLEDKRSLRRKTFVGLWLTVAGILAAVSLIPLLVLGPQFGAALADNFGLESLFETLWSILYWPVVIVIGIVLLAWVLHIAPPHSTPWRRDLPGAILALVLLGLGGLGLRIYTTNFLEANSAFSLFTAPLAILLWLYVSAIAILLGAELNAEIDKRWPYDDAMTAAPAAE